MNINTHSLEIKEIILDKIKKKENTFLLRIGDGEMRIEKEHESLDKFSIKEFNRIMTSDEIKKAKIWLKESVLESSILGLPTTQHCNQNELWSCMFDYYQDLEKKYPNSWQNKKYCSINSHYEILQSGDLFEIFSKVDKIVIVSPRDIRNRLREKFNNIKEIEYYSLPGEQAYELEKNTQIDIFIRIEEIINSINSKDRSGELLIFGAGPIGKIIGSEFSKRGGVSLDLGSVFDLFVGKITRGKGKGPDKKINPIL
jgi:hypothetical protein